MAEDKFAIAMTADERLALVVASLREALHADPDNDSPGMHDVIALAEVLAATRRELAELKAIVGTVTPPPSMADIVRAVMATPLKQGTGRATDTVRVVDPDPRPLLPGVDVLRHGAPPSKLKHGPGGTGASGPCDPDCAKCAAEGSTGMTKGTP